MEGVDLKKLGTEDLAELCRSLVGSENEIAFTKGEIIYEAYNRLKEKRGTYAAWVSDAFMGASLGYANDLRITYAAFPDTDVRIGEAPWTAHREVARYGRTKAKQGLVLDPVDFINRSVKWAQENEDAEARRDGREARAITFPTIRTVTAFIDHMEGGNTKRPGPDIIPVPAGFLARLYLFLTSDPDIKTKDNVRLIAKELDMLLRPYR